MSELNDIFDTFFNGRPSPNTGEMERLRLENTRLKAAVMWALGDEGSDFGDRKPENAAPFWWRTELRRRAFNLSPPR